MNNLNARDFGILPSNDITDQLKSMIEAIKTESVPTTVMFERGEYYIDADKCNDRIIHITNTVARDEFGPNEVPHLNRAAIDIQGATDVTLDFNDSILYISGKSSNIFLQNCQNICIKNLEIRHVDTDMHVLTVVKRGLFKVVFEIADHDQIAQTENGICFVGKGFEHPLLKDRHKAFWIFKIAETNRDTVCRTSHPLRNALSVKMIDSRHIQATYPFSISLRRNTHYYLYDVRRQYVGILIDNSRNITLENIKQRFNYSLAIVAQNSENIIVHKVDFSPAEDNDLLMCSCADFMQFCMCRGQISVTDSKFEGAGDDCLNVHGIHFKITKIVDNYVTARFMHPQAYGFEPFRSGDKIAFIDPDTLLELGQSEVTESKMSDEYNITLRLTDTTYAKTGLVIENISACPDLEFARNYVNRIITRGLLITTRGKVNVHHNIFNDTYMSTILLSDDAKSWYESGMCRDLTISDNTINHCHSVPILICPDIVRYRDSVHSNIRVLNNTFCDYPDAVINCRFAENITIANNTFACKNKIIIERCKNVVK